MQTSTGRASLHHHGATASAPDSILMTRVADGDTAAFEELYRRHHHRVLLLARKLCAGRELAEEVAQDAFTSLWRGAHAYRPGAGSVPAWLTGIVRNRAIDTWRRAAARPVEVPAPDDGPGELRAGVCVQPAAPERAAALSLIGDLPAPQREAVFLAYFGEMTHSEIAAFAGAPLGTVKGRIRLGLERLRLGVEREGAGTSVALRPTAQHAVA